MPTVSDHDLSLLRTLPQATQLFLAVYRPAIAMQGVTLQDNPPGDVTVGLGSVVESRPYYRDYLVNISHVTPGDDELGFTRLRSYPGGATGTIQIAPCNANSALGDYYTVMEYIAPMSIRPRQRAGHNIEEDWNVAYTDQTRYYRPFVHLGPPAAAWIDPLTGLATVYFHDTSIGAMVGSSVTARSWYLPGSDTVTRTDNDFYSTWDTAGQYYMNELVTETNGKTARGFRPVFIFDPPDTGGVQPITEFSLSELEGSVENAGWSTTVTIYGEASLDDYPHAAQVVIFARDWYGGEEISIGGYPGRENIVFTGWIRGSSLRRDYRKRWCEFKVEGIGPLASNISMAACNLRGDLTPANWHELYHLNSNHSGHHLLTEHSTVSHIADCYLREGVDWRDIVDLTEDSLLGQLQDQIFTASRCRVLSNAQGDLRAEKYPPLWLQSDRPAYTSVELTTADLLGGEVDFGDESEELPCNHLDFSGVHFTANNNYRNYNSYAPLNVLGTGQGETVDGILVGDQTDANQICGMFYAWKNAAYKSITLRLKGNWRVFDLTPYIRVLLTLTAAEHPRGEAWNQMPLWVTRVTYDHHPGAGLLTTLVCERNPGRVRGWTKKTEDPTLDPDPGTTTPEPVAVPYVPPASIAPGGMYAVSTYDIGGGYYPTFATTITENLGLLVECGYGRVAVHSVGDITWTWYLNGVKRLEAIRAASAWTLNVYDAAAAFVETFACGSADTMAQTITSTIWVTGASRVRAQAVPATSASDYAWGVGIWQCPA